jgi:hypothetical protein
MSAPKNHSVTTNHQGEATSRYRTKNLMKTSFSISPDRQPSISSLVESLFNRPGFTLPRWMATIFLSIAGADGLIPSTARAGESADIVAVYSSVSPAYNRTRLPGGSFRPETYAFGEGGNMGGAQKDFTIDNLKFIDVARIIAPTLASENYLPCKTTDPRHTDLLIMVYWGTSIGTDGTSSSAQYQIAQSLIPPPPPPPSTPPNGLGGTAMVSDPSTSGRASEFQAAAAVQAAADSALQQSSLITGMANRQRDRQNYENAAILGYLPEMKRVENYQMTALNQRRQDVIDEVEESRYYVVLMAYDFQPLLQHKQRKLLWETRFSIPQRRNDFSKQLAAMALSASRYFGQDSAGLVRKPLPTGHVDLGEMKSLGPVH